MYHASIYTVIYYLYMKHMSFHLIYIYVCIYIYIYIYTHTYTLLALCIKQITSKNLLYSIRKKEHICL